MAPGGALEKLPIVISESGQTEIVLIGAIKGTGLIIIGCV
jgi:hypothetical protein